MTIIALLFQSSISLASIITNRYQQNLPGINASLEGKQSKKTFFNSYIKDSAKLLLAAKIFKPIRYGRQLMAIPSSSTPLPSFIYGEKKLLLSWWLRLAARILSKLNPYIVLGGALALTGGIATRSMWKKDKILFDNGMSHEKKYKYLLTTFGYTDTKYIKKLLKDIKKFKKNSPDKPQPFNGKLFFEEFPEFLVAYFEDMRIGDFINLTSSEERGGVSPSYTETISQRITKLFEMIPHMTKEQFDLLADEIARKNELVKNPVFTNGLNAARKEFNKVHKLDNRQEINNSQENDKQKNIKQEDIQEKIHEKKTTEEEERLISEEQSTLRKILSKYISYDNVKTATITIASLALAQIGYKFYKKYNKERKKERERERRKKR